MTWWVSSDGPAVFEDRSASASEVTITRTRYGKLSGSRKDNIYSLSNSSGFEYEGEVDDEYRYHGELCIVKGPSFKYVG